MAVIWYATREGVAASLDCALTRRIRQEIDKALTAATGSVEGLCHRVFYPTVETREIERTASVIPTPSRLWLPHGWELAAAPTSVTVGGETVSVADISLWPPAGPWPTGGPPYCRLDIKPSSSASWWDGDSDLNIGIGAPWGFGVDEAAAGTLTAAVTTTTATTVSVSDGSAVGVGSLIRVDSERMTVTDRRMADTGQNTAGTLDADITAQTLAVGDGTAFTAGETILVGAEKMLVDDIAGNNLIVERGIDGTTIAAHSSGVDVYAPRTLVVTRGVLGTTAATHTSSSAVYRHEPPPLVRELAEEEAITTVLEKVTGVARVVGKFSSRLGRASTDTGDYGKVTDERREAAGQGLEALRFDVYRLYGRKVRHRAV